MYVTHHRFYVVKTKVSSTDNDTENKLPGTAKIKKNWTVHTIYCKNHGFHQTAFLFTLGISSSYESMRFTSIAKMVCTFRKLDDVKNI